MTRTTVERLAVIETEITILKGDVQEIKDLLKSHVEWEADKYDKLKEQFAGKWVERGFIAIATGISIWLIQQLLQLI